MILLAGCGTKTIVLNEPLPIPAKKELPRFYDNDVELFDDLLDNKPILSKETEELMLKLVEPEQIAGRETASSMKKLIVRDQIIRNYVEELLSIIEAYNNSLEN